MTKYQKLVLRILKMILWYIATQTNVTPDTYYRLMSDVEEFQEADRELDKNE